MAEITLLRAIRGGSRSPVTRFLFPRQENER